MAKTTSDTSSHTPRATLPIFVINILWRPILNHDREVGGRRGSPLQAQTTRELHRPARETMGHGTDGKISALFHHRFSFAFRRLFWRFWVWGCCFCLPFIFSSKLLLRSSPIRLSSWVDPHETVLNRNNSNNNATLMCVTICYYSAPAVPFVLWCSTRTGAVLCVSQCA